ncbi:disulfide isomerase/thiol-disulfide oxidase [Roseovarius litorisediminis]|uniref:Disulfide isomerase/thiol-disulfide oxidase n=1 Tax=Roseovarius litorisediminis TaxID=1312363 RepID=A0A1Y5TBK6_9RHOB|nr:DsbA family protein [Roseovarius litorisediminis]SLN56686.1 disulfide isomerase/thiol-disulfide oxidase [Roseovarius litorisediminis]
MSTRRRIIRLAGFAALVGAAYGSTGLLRRLSEPELEFEPLTGMPGFRRVTGGPVSGGATALIGLETGQAKPTISNGALCDALFGGSRDGASVQIAYFSDYRCLYCRKVSPMLARLEAKGKVQITWHELPLLGPISQRAARAALAARAQGAYAMFHERLMGTPVLPTPPYLRQVAGDAGIDADQLMQDMTSAKTESQLAVTAALARRFGFIGTPALVIGRTSVLGGIDRRMVDRLVAAERTAPLPGPCA